LTDFNIFFALPKPEKCTKWQSFTYLLLKESVANNVINVSLFGPVICELRHQQMEASSVGLCRCWRRTFWTLLIIATLKI